MGHGGFQAKCNNATSAADWSSLKAAMEKIENKERFPLSHGTPAAIYRNRKTIFVALGI